MKVGQCTAFGQSGLEIVCKKSGEKIELNNQFRSKIVKLCTTYPVHTFSNISLYFLYWAFCWIGDSVMGTVSSFSNSTI